MSTVFDRLYRKYYTWYEHYPYAYRSELQALRKVIPRRGRGLEIGVGTGRFAVPLGIRFGIDPSKNMIKIARRRGVRVRQGRGEDLPYQDAAFDYVAMIITLAFVKDPEKVLKEARRILKKRGRIVIGIIDKDSFLGGFYRKQKGIFYRKARFLRAKKLTILLQTLGFKRLRVYQTIFHLPKEMTAVEKPKRDFGRGGFVVIKATKS